MKQTKIVASISDRRCSVEFLRQLFEAGMNVARINTAHAPIEGIREVIQNIRTVSPRIGILIDTKGPEIRTTACDNSYMYRTGDEVVIVGAPTEDTVPGRICVSYPNFAQDLHAGCHVLFDDGILDVLVTDITGTEVHGTVQNDGKLGSRKSVNVPGIHIELPALTEKDIMNIRFAAEMGVDFIAHSFVRSAADVQAVQKIIDETGVDMRIISKIENQEGVDNIDEIIEASYGIMVARGDLGIEVPIERIPGIQQALITKCRRARKPVIVATQMLHSMIENPRPTRAEVTDIANAVMSRTDALMLSGETASGKYPVEAIQTMAHIAEQAEAEKDYTLDIKLGRATDDPEREFMARSVFRASTDLGLGAIIIDSVYGQMARNLSAFRGPTPIHALCGNDHLARLLNLSYGVFPHSYVEGQTKENMFHHTLEHLLENGHIRMEDRVAFLTGTYSQKGGVGTTLAIDSVASELANCQRTTALPE